MYSPLKPFPINDRPLHIAQHGVNRGAIFVDDDDRLHYLMLLAESARDHDISIHAYVLMRNHVHLLASSSRTGAISDAMRQLGQNYVPALPWLKRRSGGGLTYSHEPPIETEKLRRLTCKMSGINCLWPLIGQFSVITFARTRAPSEQ